MNHYFPVEAIVSSEHHDDYRSILYDRKTTTGEQGRFSSRPMTSLLQGKDDCSIVHVTDDVIVLTE
jgi:hypothetical protein